MNLKNKKGVTLVELLIAVVIIGTSMITIFNTFLVLRKLSNASYNKMVGVILSTDLMERACASHPTNVPDGANFQLSTLYDDMGGSGDLMFADYAKQFSATVNNKDAGIALTNSGDNLNGAPAGFRLYRIMVTRGTTKEVLATYVKREP